MLNKAFAIGLLSAATLGFASLPVRAQSTDPTAPAAQTAITNTQTSSQSAAIVGGSRNSINQRTNQVGIANVYNKAAQPPSVSVDTLQGSEQNAAIVGGYRNSVRQTTNQVHMFEQRNSTRHNRGNYYGQ